MHICCNKSAKVWIQTIFGKCCTSNLIYTVLGNMITFFFQAKKNESCDSAENEINDKLADKAHR